MPRLFRRRNKNGTAAGYGGKAVGLGFSVDQKKIECF